MKNISKAMALGVCAAALFSMGINAQETELVPGVTVAADADSATGYTATFVYENADAQNVDIVSGFAFYFDDGETRGDVPEEFATPYEWEDGMFPAQVNRYVAPLEKVEGTDYWTISLPLPSGHYQYYYTADGAEDVVFDPANMPMQSPAENGGTYEASTVDVPYDAQKQAKSRDYSFAMPRTDGQEGTLEFVNYTDVNDDTAALAVYLPYGYDAGREEPYKTLYVSHGGGGNEVHWFAGTNLHYIFDNLIAEGKVEPTIIVGMNNQAYDWDFDMINDNLVNCVIPYVEENYNVGTTSDTRAFTGQSMGGMTTSHVYYEYPDQFDYFNIMSASDGFRQMASMDLEALKRPTVMLGVGIYDFMYTNDSYGTEDDRTMVGLDEVMTELGIEHSYYEVEGAHDWYIWQQLIKIFAEEYLWK